MKKSLLITTLLILLVLGYLYYYFTKVVPKDLKKYQQYIDKKNKGCNCAALSPTMQKRHHVQKNIWYQKNGERLSCKMLASDSELHMLPQGNTWIFEENLHDISCIMQEPSDHHFVKIKKLKALDGTYLYHQNLFVAEKVHLSFFDLPETATSISLDEKTSYLKGVAEQVSLHLKDHTMSFQADKFKAEMTKDLGAS